MISTTFMWSFTNGSKVSGELPLLKLVQEKKLCCHTGAVKLILPKQIKRDERICASSPA